MQELAKYSFAADFESATDALDRYISVIGRVDQWILGKGATSPLAEKGTFLSKKRGANGHYTQKTYENDNDHLREILLLDHIKGQHAFATNLRVGLVGCKVVVYCALSVQRSAQVIAPINAHPRCPGVIRDIISGYGGWKFEGDIVPSGDTIDAAGYEAGCDLSARILDRSRKYPILVVSDDPECLPWADVAQRLASDLVGVAHVANANEDGSWALTDELGKSQSCYLGAVRLYWPITTDDLHSSVWTAARLLSEYGGNAVGQNKFQEKIREIVFETSSLSLSNPKLLREVAKRELPRRLKIASAEDQEKELSAIIEENSALLDQLGEANSEIARLRSKVLSLSSQLSERPPVEVATEAGEINAHVPARDGDLRFYKKIGKSGSVDKLVVTNECNHGSWEVTPKAIQAQKGVMKLEGRNGWRSFQHCGTCTNGGRWKVQW